MATTHPKLYRSFVGVILAKPGMHLLGGVTLVHSSRFETHQQAEDYVAAMSSNQQDRIATTRVVPSFGSPEIFASETGHNASTT